MTPITPIAVVVVNYGSSDLLLRHLAPLAEQDPELRPVVVDNHSTEGERAAVRRLCSERGWALVEQPNLGFGAGTNAGVTAAIAAGCHSVLLLNPDAWITADAVHALARRLESVPLALVAPTVRTVDGRVWSDGAWLERDRGRTRGRRPDPDRGPASFWISAACLMTTADAWQRIGGFDESYFLYWEDVDLSERAQRVGVQLIVCEDVEAVHDQGGTQHSSAVSPLSWQYYFFNIRNRLLFGAIHLEREHWRKWVWSTPRESYQIMLRGSGRRVFRAPFRASWTMVRAVVSGLLVARRTRATRRLDD